MLLETYKASWAQIGIKQLHLTNCHWSNGIAGSLESMFSDVEISLMALEDTIGARELQERQLDQRFQLAIYQERRKAEFNELASEFQFSPRVFLGGFLTTPCNYQNTNTRHVPIALSKCLSKSIAWNLGLGISSLILEYIIASKTKIWPMWGDDWIR